MKKLLLLVPAITLLAAGCNASQQATVQTPPADQITQNTQTQTTQNANPQDNVPPASRKTEQQIAAGKRISYQLDSYGVSFKYNEEVYTAPQFIAEQNGWYLGDNTIPGVETAKAYIRISNLKDKPTTYIDDEYDRLQVSVKDGSCKVLSRENISGQKALEYQCSDLGDSHSVLIKHPNGSYIQVDGVFTGPSFQELINSIKFSK